MFRIFVFLLSFKIYIYTNYLVSRVNDNQILCSCWLCIIFKKKKINATIKNEAHIQQQCRCLDLCNQLVYQHTNVSRLLSFFLFPSSFTLSITMQCIALSLSRSLSLRVYLLSRNSKNNNKKHYTRHTETKCEPNATPNIVWQRGSFFFHYFHRQQQQRRRQHSLHS